MTGDPKLQFDFEWQDPAGAKGEELRATWASLSIRVGEEIVTEVLDRRSQTVRTHLFLPLYPLAEWLVTNWWFLTTETARPQDDECTFARRHNLRSAREGFALPSLRLVSLGAGVEVQWQPWELPEPGVRFLARGQAILSRDGFERTLSNFVDAVVLRLEELGVNGTLLQEEWTEIQNTSGEEREFCEAAARLGVDPYAVEKPIEQLILGVSQQMREELLDDLLSVSTIDQLDDHAQRLDAVVAQIASDDDPVDALEPLRSSAPKLANFRSPWEKGYEFASSLRKKLGGGKWKSHSLDDLAGHLHLDGINHCLVPAGEGMGFFDAVIGVNHHDVPKLTITKQRPDSKQFAFCRALFEHLTVAPEGFAMVSRLRTERQQMSRAFAAEFLAPCELLRGDLSGESIGEDELDDLSAEYGVSTYVIRHQLENHKLARIEV